VTWAILRHHARQSGECAVRQAALARELGVKERAVRNYLAELQRAGLLETRRGGYGRAATYFLSERPAPACHSEKSNRHDGASL
jgi:DNA-binding IscR family transcriptional regulator